MSAPLRTFYVFRASGAPLGTLDADDANAAQIQATAMHGGSAYVFPASHIGPAGRWLACEKQAAADAAEVSP